MFHQQQPPAASLSQLREFLSQISHKPEAYWQAILQSDIRNILPKHEVCKIEIIKNALSKTRLIMENLNIFISLEVQKKHLKHEMIDFNQNIANQLQQIVTNQKQFSDDQRFHYDTGLNKRKKQLEVIAKELTRFKPSHELKLVIQRNDQWQQYIEKHLKQLDQVNESDLDADITNLISTYPELFLVQLIRQASSFQLPSPKTAQQLLLKSGNYIKLYQDRLEDRVLISKLLDSVYGSEEESKEPIDQDQYCQQQVEKIRNLNQI